MESQPTNKKKIKIKVKKKSLNLTLKKNKLMSPKPNNSKQQLIFLFKIIIQKINTDGHKAAVFKAKQYTDAIRILELYTETQIDDFDNICQFFEKNGKKKTSKIVSKIDEYVKTGTIEEAELALQDPKVKAVMELTKIYGIGPKKALDLYNEHQVSNVNDLRKIYAKDKTVINSKQILGMNYFEDLESRIPRKEMDEFNSILKKSCNDVSSDIIMSINGSYRRGLNSSGDIDLLITSKSEIPSEILRQKLIKHLIKIGLIKDILANGKKKFMGIVKLEGFTTHRHIDIIDTSPKNYPFAVLYFTGSGAFNANMRAHAIKEGYSLNEYELTEKITKRPIKPEVIQSKIGKSSFETEEDIFKFLNYKYKTPEERELITLSKI